MNEIIKVDNLTIYYGNNNRALENISIDVMQNDFVGIVGQNGSGKSTLLKAILGLIPIKYGKVLIEGTKNNKNIKIGYVPQYSQMNTSFPITALDAVALGTFGKGIHPFSYLKKEQKDIALSKLKLLHVDNLAERQLTELSGGEFQRMLIARALTVEPDILVLDEPTASIDAKSREMIYQLLKELSGQMTILLVTHDLEEVLNLASKILCLNNKVTYYGSSNITIDDVNKYCNK